MKFLPNILALILIPVSGQCEDFFGDAFGVLPLSGLSEERSKWAGARRLGQTTSHRAPEDAGDILLFVGPKSLVAGKGNGHAVALVLDRSGNLAADGQEVSFTLRRGQNSRALTRFGFADVPFVPDHVAATHLAGATLGVLQSARASYRVTSDLSQSSSRIATLSEPIPMEQIRETSTGPILDIHENRSEDGIFATMIVQHEDAAASLIPAITLNGVARGQMLARDIPSKGTFELDFAGRMIEGPSVEVERVLPLTPPNVVIEEVASLDAVRLTLGPFTTRSGHFLNDGAVVGYSVTDAAGHMVKGTGWLRDGIFEGLVPLNASDAPFELQVSTVLGSVFQRIDAGEIR